MRLIDADALRKYFEVPHELKCGIQAGMDEYALKCIDEQPTIPAPRWVRVEEPPKENGRYLVSWEGAVTTDEYKNGVWLYASMFNLCVTHWMPLPEPPKEDA